ncbi:hypothetical protein RCO48_07505 [Peribacillus frigoritolerans]|nr:hypothetical protein [Peribacillus frigoritolerans]
MLILEVATATLKLIFRRVTIIDIKNMEGEPMIYFDNSATTKPYPEVIESFMKVTSDYLGTLFASWTWGAIRKTAFRCEKADC